jgi:hypothetical protein
MLPWVQSLLEKVQQEYAKPVPTFCVKPSVGAEKTYALRIAQEEDPFDELKLKKDMVQMYQGDEAFLETCTSDLGTITVLRRRDTQWQPSWEVWLRAARLLCPGKQIRIVIFAHPRARELPPRGTRIGPQHINGGYTTKCDSKSVVVYRQEEATRVLVHELFHASCSDPYHKDTPFIEADTEAWAEVVLCAMAARGDMTKWRRYFLEQVRWAVRQAATLRDWYGVQYPQEYAWRYGVGRVDVWRRLGLQVPSVPIKYRPVDSLRLTHCEPQQ